mgnify:FL=1
MGGVILIIVLTIAGGVIAYVGDRIGMKVGRKRLSIFGLRPKYTSMVITIITGVIIAGCTLLVLSLASENVRIALFEIRELQDSLATANNDLEAKRAEVDVLSARVREVADEYDALESKFEAANRELDRVSHERSRALQELAKVESKLRDSESRLRETETRYKQAGADLARASGELERARDEIASLESEKMSLERNVSSLSAAQASLEKSLEQMKLDMTAQTATSALIMAEAEKSSWYGEVVFRAKEVILGEVVDCSRPRTEVNNQVTEILLKVNAIASKRGARSSRDDDPFVLLFDEGNYLAAIKDLHEAEGKMIFRVLSYKNSWYGDPLVVEVEVFPDAKIYSAGDVIVSRTINGAAGGAEVQKQLLALMEDVNAACIGKGMTSDEEGRIGTIMTISDFTSAIVEIVKSNANVKVEAVARRDIWRSHKSPPVELVMQGI